MEKPYSPACDRNKDPILKVMQEVINLDDRRLLEIGSGTGQHAVYLAPHFSHMIWVTSDLKRNHEGISMWLNESGAPNIVGPGAFEVGKDDFPEGNFDVVFASNLFHIMHWKECQTLMKMMGVNLGEGSRVLIYGAFNYKGKFSSPSNEEFDTSLKARDPLMGIRNFEDVNSGMEKNGFRLVKDYEMPVNNRILVYTRVALVN